MKQTMRPSADSVNKQAASRPQAPFGGLYGTRPFVPTSGDQFRPPLHPASGSAEFLPALAEILRRLA